MASPTASSKARARKTATVDAAAVFRAELNELYNRAGRPTPATMSRTAGRPPELFGFLRTTTLPTQDELLTFLVAMKQPAAVAERFRARHSQLERRLKDDQVATTAAVTVTRWRVPGTAAAPGPQVTNLDNLGQALAAAQIALTATEFADALTRFRSTAQLRGKDTPPSYLDMANLSGKRLSKSAAQRLATANTLPSKATQVEDFVRACGATDEQVALWLVEYQRLKRGAPPTLGHHAGAASTEDNTKPSRARTEGILAGLADTDGFTATKLSLDGRNLILFITAAIADDTGSADTTYRAVLRRHGDVSGHWAFGMTLPQLDAYMAQYVGRTARKVPLWPMIHDLLEVAVRDPDARTQVLADAAGLYNQVAGEPPPGYTTTMHLPWWGYPITGRTQLDTIRATLPHPSRKLTESELELIELREDNSRYRQMLDSTIRAVRELTTPDTRLHEAQLATRAEALNRWERRLAERETHLNERETHLAKQENRSRTRNHPLTKRQRQLAYQQHQPPPSPNSPFPQVQPPTPPTYITLNWPLQHAAGT